MWCSSIRELGSLSCGRAGSEGLSVEVLIFSDAVVALVSLPTLPCNKVGGVVSPRLVKSMSLFREGEPRRTVGNPAVVVAGYCWDNRCEVLHFSGEVSLSSSTSIIESITRFAPSIKLFQRPLRPLLCGSNGDLSCRWWLREEEEAEEVIWPWGGGSVAAEAVRWAASVIVAWRGVVVLSGSLNWSTLLCSSSSDETSRPASCRRAT